MRSTPERIAADLEERWAASGTPEHRALARLVHRLEQVAYRDSAGMRLGEGDPCFDRAKAALRTSEPTRPSGGDGGAEAMRAACAAVALTDCRSPFAKQFDVYPEWDSYAIDIAAAIRALPLPQDQAPRQGGEG